MDTYALMEKYRSAVGLPLLLVKERDILTAFQDAHSDFGLNAALVSSLPKKLPDVWTTATPEGILLGGLQLQSHGEFLILGPLFAFECTLQMARKLAHRLSLPDQLASDLALSMNLYSPCDMQKLQHHLLFLNHLLNQRADADIVPIRFQWSSLYRSDYKPREEIVNDEDGSDLESKIIHLIRSGDEEKLTQFFNEKLFIYDSPMRLQNLRPQRRYLIGANMLLSRLAMQEGVDRNIINIYTDQFGERIEQIVSGEDFNHIFLEFCLFYTRQIANVHNIPSKNPIAVQVSRYVQTKLYEPISLTQMADALGYNKSYLCTSFKKATGETLSHYINRRKIREARLLLQEHRLKIQEVSNELGFSDPAYFIKVYKEIIGTTPGKDLPFSGK